MAESANAAPNSKGIAPVTSIGKPATQRRNPGTRTREDLLAYKRAWRKAHPGKSTRALREEQIRKGTAFCDCSRPAVVCKGNQFICQTCLDIDEPGHQHRDIKPRKHKTITAKYHGNLAL